MKNINIGMTFYGGVSLAVYEAGVAEEFIRFIQFCKNEWQKFNDGPPSVDIRVISGASAGGLAAVLMASTLVNANDPSNHIKEMRRIWFDVADLSTLQYQAGQNIRSLLNNDILEEEVEHFLKIKEGSQGLCEKISILITATNMQGFFDAIPVEHDFVKKDEYAERVFPTTRYTEVFTFTGSKIKEAGTEQGKKIRKRIAKAARITSSFPAAFPPQFALSPSFPEETMEWYKYEKSNENKPLHFWYFDGGVLDNKPLGHAIDHIESSREEGEWWYFFVEPKPQDYEQKRKTWGVDPQNPPDPAATVAAVLEARGEETIYYDLRRIQKINHQVMQINSLVSELSSLLTNSANLPQGFLDTLEESIKTARLHQFLPDFLKCVTMIRYSFLRKEKLAEKKKDELERLNQLALDTIRPLDLTKTIKEINNQEIITKNLPSDLPKALRDDQKVRDALTEFDKAAEKVKDAQLLFRQVTFWVEDNDRTDNELLEETWSAFIEAGDKLKEALHTLNSAYNKVVNRIKKLLSNDELLQRIKSVILLNEAIHAAAGVETREKIKVVKIYHNEKKYGSLAGAKLANFAGFLERRWRKHDYRMGIMNAREMLKGRMEGNIPDKRFWDAYEGWRSDLEEKMKQKFGEKYSLSKADVLEEEDRKLVNLPASRLISQVNGMLNTSEKVIKKHEDKDFYSILKKLKIPWMLTAIRCILWLIKQATAQPTLNHAAPQGRDTSNTLRNFIRSGKRYFWFMVIGFIMGLVISFFLPDFFRDAAHWLWKKLGLLGPALLIVLLSLWRVGLWALRKRKKSLDY